MKLRKENTIIYIDDSSPIALKIKEGYDYIIENGEIKIGKIYTVPKNKWQFSKELDKATSILEIKTVIAKMLEKWPE